MRLFRPVAMLALLAALALSLLPTRAVAQGAAISAPAPTWVGDSLHASVVADCQTFSGAVTSTASSGALNIVNASFAASDVGKSIYIDIEVPNSFSRTVYVGTITGVTDATDITVSPTFPTSYSGVGSEFNSVPIVYGTDNSASIAAAGTAAAAAGNRLIYFRRGAAGTGLNGVVNSGICAFGISPSTAAAALGLPWTGDPDSWSFVTDASGNVVSRIVVPSTAGPAPAPQPGVFGSVSLPRFSANTSVCVMAIGDSMANDPPMSGFALTESPIEAFMDELIRQNPTKTITYVNYAMGGAIWQWLDSVPPGPAWPAWYTNHSTAWLTVAQTGCPGSATPDLVVLMENGLNDGATISDEAMISVLNKIRAWPTRGGLAPDIIMNTGRRASLTDSNYGTAAAQFGAEYAHQLIRTTALNLGFGLLDFEAYANGIAEGWDPTRLGLVQSVHATENTVGGTTPFNFQKLARDFQSSIRLTGASGSAAWSAAGAYVQQIGARPDNVLVASVNASNDLQYQFRTWGNVSVYNPTPPNATVTTDGSTGALTVGSATTLNCTITTTNQGSPLNTTTINASASCFSSGMLGDALLVPGGDYPNVNSGVFRSFVQQYISATQIVVSPPLPLALTATPVTMSYAPILFQPQDATAQIDVTVAGAGAAGALLTGKVSTYTSATQVTLNQASGAALSASAKQVTIGRISHALTATSLLAGSSLAANPYINVSARGSGATVTYSSVANLVNVSTNVSISASGNALTTSSAAFSADEVGNPLTVPGAGASGGTLNTYIASFVNSQSITTTDNAQTTLSAAAETLTIGTNSALVYRGPIERFGGPFVLMAATQSSIHLFNNNLWVDTFLPVMPRMTMTEMWGTSAGLACQTSNYVACGNGANHPTTYQVDTIDRLVDRVQNLQ